jgi:hypothetical protein
MHRRLILWLRRRRKKKKIFFSLFGLEKENKEEKNKRQWSTWDGL